MANTSGARLGLFRMCTIGFVAFALMPRPSPAQSDWTVPLLQGVHAVTVVANIYVDGSATDRKSTCHIDETELERDGADVLHRSGLEAFGGLERLARMRALQQEFSDALNEWKKAPLDVKPPDYREQTERRQREIDFLGALPFLSVHVGVATTDGGLCAAGITTEFRAFARPGETTVLNYNEKKLAHRWLSGEPLPSP